MPIRRLVLIASLLTILGCCLFIASKQDTAFGQAVAGVFERSQEQIWRRQCKALYAEMTSPEAQILFIEYNIWGNNGSGQHFTVNGKRGTGPEALKEVERWIKTKRESGPVVSILYRPCIDDARDRSEDRSIIEKIHALESDLKCISIGNTPSSSSPPLYFLYDDRVATAKQYDHYSIMPIPQGIDLDGFIRGLSAKFKAGER